MNKNKEIVKLDKINKYYDKNHILKDVSFSIYEGDKIAFIGGNGSGKSTTVEIIAKIREASSGTITYDPNLIVGMQFQESVYPVGITVKGLIDFYLNRYLKTITKDDLQQMLKDFRLENFYKKQIFEMSGGQKQRLNILLALIHNPSFLILDELSTGLDIKVRRELRDYIMAYLDKHKKASLILITHSMVEAEKMANRVIVLNWGKITHDLKMDEIKKQYKSLEAFSDKIFKQMYKEDIQQRGSIESFKKDKPKKGGTKWKLH